MADIKSMVFHLKSFFQIALAEGNRAQFFMVADPDSNHVDISPINPEQNTDAGLGFESCRNISEGGCVKEESNIQSTSEVVSTCSDTQNLRPKVNDPELKFIRKKRKRFSEQLDENVVPKSKKSKYPSQPLMEKGVLNTKIAKKKKLKRTQQSKENVGLKTKNGKKRTLKPSSQQSSLTLIAKMNNVKNKKGRTKGKQKRKKSHCKLHVHAAPIDTDGDENIKFVAQTSLSFAQKDPVEGNHKDEPADNSDDDIVMLESDNINKKKDIPCFNLSSSESDREDENHSKHINNNDPTIPCNEHFVLTEIVHRNCLQNETIRCDSSSAEKSSGNAENAKNKRHTEIDFHSQCYSYENPECYLSKESRLEMFVNNLDISEEPVEFPVPFLHQLEKIKSLSRDSQNHLRSKGISILRDEFSVKEKEILLKNWKEFVRRFEIEHCTLFYETIFLRKRWKRLRLFIARKHFYVRLARGLDERTLADVFMNFKHVCGSFESSCEGENNREHLNNVLTMPYTEKVPLTELCDKNCLQEKTISNALSCLEKKSKKIKNNKIEIPSEIDFNSHCNRPKYPDYLSNKESTIEYLIQNLNLSDESVEFPIPILHELENICPLSSEYQMQLRDRGIPIKKGQFSRKEKRILLKNWAKFMKRFEGEHRTLFYKAMFLQKREKTLKRFLSVKRFYVRLARGLDTRMLHEVFDNLKRVYGLLK